MDKMSTKRQKRVTRQVRVSTGIHRAVRVLAMERGITVSKLVDEILLENLELNSLLTSKADMEKKHRKRIRGAEQRENKKTIEAFNKIKF